MLLLGIDMGTSSVKATVADAATCEIMATAQYPETEADIRSLHEGWAEQSPDQWWKYVKQAILKCHASGKYDPLNIGSIGIAYQMHGLVMVDKQQRVLRDAIIWCDSRAIDIGNIAFKKIGKKKCLSHLLNSPGNFTASKLAWVKKNEPSLYEKTDKIMLPGDFISMKFTGEVTTTVPALSEAVLWDFKEQKISDQVMNYFGFEHNLLPHVQDVFRPHGLIKKTVAKELSLKRYIPVAYKAGDQPNNAFSLNVLQPGEVAATAGTSGVIYAVCDTLSYDQKSRINSFAHVNHTTDTTSIGMLLNINGCGIFNKWVRQITGKNISYKEMNRAAAGIAPGSDGLFTLPFGNGAERMLENHIIGAHLLHIDVNVHSAVHLYRSALEGIAFAFRYGFDIMKENGVKPDVIRTARANLFQSPVYSQLFADVNNVPVEVYNGDGSFGAALGAGAGTHEWVGEFLRDRKPIDRIHPKQTDLYDSLYHSWKERLLQQWKQ